MIKCLTFLLDILKAKIILEKVLKIIISGLSTELTTELLACKKTFAMGSFFLLPRKLYLLVSFVNEDLNLFYQRVYQRFLP